MLSPGVCPSVCPSRWSIVSRRLKISSNFFLGPVAHDYSFLTPSADTQFQREPLQRRRKIQGVGEFCDFRLKSPFISETVRDRPVCCYEMLIGNHMRCIEWWHFQWPWRTPNPVFKVTALLKSNISNIGTKLLNANRKLYAVYRVVPLSITLIDPWPGFQSRDIFHIKYLKNDTR